MIEQLDLDISGKGKIQALRLARDIFVKIVREVYSEGLQLPSVREIARNTSVSDYSARKILLGLSKAGLIESRQGKGMFVVKGAKERAIELLDNYDDEFAGIKNDHLRSKPATIAVAAAFKQTIDGPQIYHPQTVSGIYKEAQSLGFAVELINFNVDISDPEQVVETVEDCSYQGVIWLYPEVKHWQSINALRDKGIAVVISSHWLFDTPLPCVQVNEYTSTISVLHHLADVEKCDVINWFSTENYAGSDKSTANDYAKVASSGGDRILKMAMEEVSNRNCKLNIIEYSRCRVATEKTLQEVVYSQDVKNGIVIAATSEYTDFFKRYTDCYDKMKRHSLVIAATITQFPRIAPINEALGKVNVCLVPFEDVGRALATKISGLLAGRFVENTTLINTTFSTYSDILYQQNGLGYTNSAENSNVYENKGSLLLSV